MSTDGDSATGEWTMTATEFRAKCLGLIDEVAETGREIVITKRGRPVARLVPYRRKPRSLFGMGRGRMKILGDITAPIDVEWEAETEPKRVVPFCSSRLWENAFASIAPRPRVSLVYWS